MRIRQQNRAQSAPPQLTQELFRTQQIAHLLTNFVFQTRDIDVELMRPIIGAVPVERSMDCREARLQGSPRLLQSQTVAPRKALGDEFQPEIIVKLQVEQRAVHVQQHRIDALPIRTMPR